MKKTTIILSVILFTSKSVHAKCDWDSVQAARELKALAECSSTGTLEQLGACTPVDSAYLTDLSKAQLYSGVTSGLVGGVLGDRLPQFYLSYVERSLAPALVASANAFNASVVAGQHALVSEIKTNVGNFKLYSGREAYLVSETGKKYNLGSSVTKSVLEDVGQYVLKAERAPMIATNSIRDYAIWTARYADKMVSNSAALTNLLKNKLGAKTVSVTHLNMQTVLVKHAQQMMKFASLGSAAMSPVTRISLALKNFMKPGFLRGATLGVGSFGVGLAAPYLVGAYTLACTANDYIKKIKTYPVDDTNEEFEQRMNKDFKLNCERSIASLNALRDKKVLDIRCGSGSTNFVLEHFPMNTNYCAEGPNGEKQVGEKIRTEIQILHNARTGQIQAANYIDSNGLWRSGKYKDINRSAPHALYTKVSGVVFTVLQECKNRSLASHPAVSQIVYGAEKGPRAPQRSKTSGAKVAGI